MIQAASDVEDASDLVIRLQRSEERLRLALEATRVGTWYFDLRDGTREWSPEFRSIIGAEDTLPASPDIFTEVIHPADRDWVVDRYASVYRIGAPSDYEAEFRIIRCNDGEERWVVTRGRVYQDSGGHPLRGVGTIQDVTERKQVEIALRASEGRLRATHENAAVGNGELDPDGRIRSVNQALCRLTGYSREELLDAQSFTFVTTQDHSNEDGAMFARQVAGEIDSYEIEKKIIRKDGQERWAHVSSTSIRSPAGTFMYAVRVVQDITDAKLAAIYQNLLIGELNHRVKNSLAVVLSMVSQTVRTSPSPTHFRTAIEGRVMALKRSYDLLSDTNWRGADLEGLLRAELDAFGASDAGRWSIQGPAVQLGPKQIVAVALIVHELATNAAKYGGLAQGDGHVALTWDLLFDGSGRRISLVWWEQGGPGFPDDAQDGFGTRLISTCAERELGGSWTRETAHGHRVTVVFPVETAAAEPN